jgi:hypothetical protein
MALAAMRVYALRNSVWLMLAKWGMVLLVYALLSDPIKIRPNHNQHYLTTFLWFSGLETAGIMPANWGMIYTRLTCLSDRSFYLN